MRKLASAPSITRPTRTLLAIVLGAAVAAAAPPAAYAAVMIPVGAKLIASDGKFLGAYGCTAANALGNPYGHYGSRYSSDSIWNEYGSYGSEYAAKSPYNKFSSTYPRLIDDDGETIANVSVNEFARLPRISPAVIEARLQDLCSLDEPLR